MPTLTFKVTAAEARQIRAKARAARAESVSAYLRRQALGETPPKSKIVRRIHPVSGLPYDAAPGPIVTDEQIRAVLAEFP